MKVPIHLIYGALFLYSLLMSASVFSAAVDIKWNDNSDNEDGFIVEKRLMDENIFTPLVFLPANSKSYHDSDVINNQTYCYRIIAYNKAGNGKSDKVCTQILSDSFTQATVNVSSNIGELVNTPEKALEAVPASGNIAISHELILQPTRLEIGQKTFYSFKSNRLYNSQYTDDRIDSPRLIALDGKVSYSNKDIFSFQDNGQELDKGLAIVKFSKANTLSFVLHGSGNEQVARLYLQAGVWSKEKSSIIINVGDKVDVIPLSGGYRWHNYFVDITFDGTAPVTVTTDSDRFAYSALKFAGIVLQKAN